MKGRTAGLLGWSAPRLAAIVLCTVWSASALAATPDSMTYRALRGRAPGSTGLLSPDMSLYELVNFYRVGRGLPAIDPRTGAPGNPHQRYRSPLSSAINEWRTAVASWSSAGFSPPAWVEGTGRFGGGEWLNCPAAAFAQATKTLRDRVEHHDPAWVAEWVYGQDQVFNACRGDGSAELPESAPPHAPRWFAMDRAYQRAASWFYQQRYAEAASAFDAIAHDADSPWQPWGLYMAGRAWLRMANQDDQPEAWTRARLHFEAILADTHLSQRHGDARALLRMIAARTAPEQSLRELAVALSGPLRKEDAAGMLRDFRWLWKRSRDRHEMEEDLLEWIEAAIEGPSTWRTQTVAEATRRMEHLRSKTQVHWRMLLATWDVAVAPLDASTRDWLVGIRSSAPHGDAALWLLVQDAQQRRDLDAAERGMRLLTRHIERWSDAEQDMIGSAMIAYVRNRGELLRFGITLSEPPASTSRVEFNPDYYMERQVVMRREVNTLVAALPAREILAIARDVSFPSAFRHEALRVAWLRAVISANHAVAREASQDIVAMSPPLDIRRAAVLYLASPSQDGRLEALMLALERGALSPTPFEHSTFAWCSAEIWSVREVQRWQHSGVDVSSVAEPTRAHYFIGGRRSANVVDAQGYRYPGAMSDEWHAEQRALWDYDNGSVAYARLALPLIAAGLPTEDKALRLKRVRGVLRGGCPSLNDAMNAEWQILRRWAEVLAQTSYRGWNPVPARRAAIRSWIWMLRYQFLPTDLPDFEEELVRAVPIRTH